MSKSIRVLLIEDSEDDALLLIRNLKKSGYEPEYDRVETAEAMRKALTEKTWDLILCDYKLPRFDGLAALSLLKETGIELPFILVSGTIGDETAVVAMKAGTHDYIMKDNLSRLVPAIERELKEASVRRERKQAKAALQSSERRLADIIEFLPDATLVIDRDGKVIAWNRAIEAMTGVHAEEMLGKGDYEYALPFYGERRPILIDLAMSPNLEKEKNYSTIERRGDILFGEAYTPGIRSSSAHLSATASVLRDETGEIIAAIECIRDNTAIKQAQEELRQAEQRYRTIFENTQEGIYRSTPEGSIIMANPAMAKMFGYATPKELMTGVADVARQHYVHPEERTKIKALLEEQGFVRNYETQIYRKDGGVFWISITMQVVRDEKGQIIYYEGIDEDITERKESVLRLRKALGGTVQAISMAVEMKDPYTAGHQRRTADLARSIAVEMGLSADRTDFMRIAATIHDIGKIALPAEILSKPTKLTEIEFSLIKTHSNYGYDILKDIEFPWPVADVILQHHERMNGSGYPNGLKGDEILFESRILAVADVVEAIASHRPYRPARGIDVAMDEISKNKGVLYDGAVVDACLLLFREKGYRLE